VADWIKVFFDSKQITEVEMLNATDSNSNETNRDSSKDAIVARKNMSKSGQPFLVEWRRPEINASSWQGDSGAGCGCGPVE
jgi:hypothetical protein